MKILKFQNHRKHVLFVKSMIKKIANVMALNITRVMLAKNSTRYASCPHPHRNRKSFAKASATSLVPLIEKVVVHVDFQYWTSLACKFQTYQLN